MYLVFTRVPGESYRRWLRSLLYLRYVFRALINSLVCWFCTCSGFFQRAALQSIFPTARMCFCVLFPHGVSPPPPPPPPPPLSSSFSETIHRFPPWLTTFGSQNIPFSDSTRNLWQLSCRRDLTDTGDWPISTRRQDTPSAPPPSLGLSSSSGLRTEISSGKNTCVWDM